MKTLTKKIMLSTLISLSVVFSIQAQSIITGAPPNGVWTAVYYDGHGIARGTSSLTLGGCNTNLARAAQEALANQLTPIVIIQPCSS